MRVKLPPQSLDNGGQPAPAAAQPASTLSVLLATERLGTDFPATPWRHGRQDHAVARIRIHRVRRFPLRHEFSYR
ncbi:hypothetical protein [Nocardia brasiliensis]|uniref:hypothetical protein n=1 Tax=Nocardia brasiliensis TaxID=37326 RepID=UPI002457F859|nr:hypothetical protein [Nocardia brasiliensis]